MEKVLQRTGVKSRTTIYNWVDSGFFPKPIKIRPRVVVWDNREIDNWMKEVIK